MNPNTHMPGSAGSDVPVQPHPYSRSNTSLAGCSGNCMETARALFEGASAMANPADRNHQDVVKRFQFVKDVAATDPHKEAEIVLEQAVALYELAYGQEHPSMAEIMLRLADVYAMHGNKDSAEYMRNWANDILNTQRQEPTHEFFHLFGMDHPEEGAGGIQPA
jgi:hypothetical protein